MWLRGMGSCGGAAPAVQRYAYSSNFSLSSPPLHLLLALPLLLSPLRFFISPHPTHTQPSVSKATSLHPVTSQARNPCGGMVSLGVAQLHCIESKSPHLPAVVVRVVL